MPWNNNNAEHAIKPFAYYREVADGQITEAGLTDYLVLLSVYQTCKYKGVSFLKFLLSRETDIDVFRRERRQEEARVSRRNLPGRLSVATAEPKTSGSHTLAGCR